MPSRPKTVRKVIVGTIVPFLSFFAVAKIFGGNELLITVGVILILIPSLFYGYIRGEWKVFLLGVALGFFIEVVLSQVYQEQYWTNASLYTVPIWVPLVWGGGFVLIRRFTDLLVARHRT